MVTQKIIVGAELNLGLMCMPKSVVDDSVLMAAARKLLTGGSLGLGTRLEVCDVQ